LTERRGPIRELQAKRQDLEKRLARYYNAFEEGTLDPADVTERIAELNVQKREVEAELADRKTVKELPASISSPENVKRVQEDLRAVFQGSTPQTQKAYLRILVEEIILDGEKVTIRAKNAGVMAFLDGNEKFRTGGVTPVLNRLHKWQPICSAVKNSVGQFQITCNACVDNVLHFPSRQVALWLHELVERTRSQREVAEFIGVPRQTVWRYLRVAA